MYNNNICLLTYVNRELISLSQCCNHGPSHMRHERDLFIENGLHSHLSVCTKKKSICGLLQNFSTFHDMSDILCVEVHCLVACLHRVPSYVTQPNNLLYTVGWRCHICRISQIKYGTYVPSCSEENKGTPNTHTNTHSQQNTDSLLYTNPKIYGTLISLLRQQGKQIWFLTHSSVLTLTLDANCCVTHSYTTQFLSTQ